MAGLSSREIQRNYVERKEKKGWKRIQIWKIDETNEEVQMRIKLGAQLVNQSEKEKYLMEELTRYNDEMLKGIIW
ncbi:MAG: hypothetical protein ACK5Z5_05350 [Neisseriaceae bacterium]